MLKALIAKNMVGFVDNNITRPNIDDLLYKA